MNPNHAVAGGDASRERNFQDGGRAIEARQIVLHLPVYLERQLKDCFSKKSTVSALQHLPTARPAPCARRSAIFICALTRVPSLCLNQSRKAAESRAKESIAGFSVKHDPTRRT